MSQELLILSRADVCELLSLRECIDAVERAFRLHAEGRTLAPGVLCVPAAGGGFHINAAGLQMGLVGSQNATFPGNSVVAATLQNLGSFTIPANDAEAGAVYQLEIEANFTQAAGTATTIRFTSNFAGTTDGDQTLGAAFCAAGGTGRFYGRVRAYCVTTGVSGTWKTSLLAITTPTAGPAGSYVAEDNSSGSVITADTTASQVLALKVAWGTTTGSPGITNRVTIAGRIA